METRKDSLAENTNRIAGYRRRHIRDLLEVPSVHGHRVDVPGGPRSGWVLGSPGQAERALYVLAGRAGVPCLIAVSLIPAMIAHAGLVYFVWAGLLSLSFHRFTLAARRLLMASIACSPLALPGSV
jgi:hypothetical protein